jgi:hypothetical protein
MRTSPPLVLLCIFFSVGVLVYAGTHICTLYGASFGRNWRTMENHFRLLRQSESGEQASMSKIRLCHPLHIGLIEQHSF